MSKFVKEIKSIDDLSGQQSSQSLKVLDFYADWCGPCQAFAPTFEKIAGEYHERIEFIKINIDAAPSLASEFGIKSIPTIVVIQDQNEIGRSVGAPSATSLRQTLTKLLSEEPEDHSHVGCCGH